jgi:hypothetical protein
MTKRAADPSARAEMMACRRNIHYHLPIALDDEVRTEEATAIEAETCRLWFDSAHHSEPSRRAAETLPRGLFFAGRKSWRQALLRLSQMETLTQQ